MRFVDAGPIPSPEPGRAVRVEVEGVGVAVFATPTGLRALDDRCPHAGGPLHAGRCDDGVVTCPWHAFRFAVETGVCLVGEGRTGARSRTLRLEGGRLLVEA